MAKRLEYPSVFWGLPNKPMYGISSQQGKGWKTGMAKTLLKETGRGVKRTLSQRSLGEIPRGIKRVAKKAVKREVSKRISKGLDDIFG